VKASSSAAAKKTAGTSTRTKAPARRKRQTGVRERLLEILAAGPITGPDLLKNGKFTQSSLHLHLKALRDAGMIVSRRIGKAQEIRLAQMPPAAEASIEGVVVDRSEPKEDPKPSASAALLPAAFVSRELHDALSAISFRLSPVERAQEKLLVLDQLARTMPGPVSEVLRAVMDDVVKLSSLK
jgi:DNA-binding transcriptional ArsR family regulator